MSKVIISAFVVIATYVAQASYLYWQVDTVDYESYYDGDAVGAYLYAYKGDDTETRDEVGKNELGTAGYSIDLTDYNNYNFYVEVVNYANGTDTAVTRSQSYAYADITDYVVSSISDIAMVNAMHATNYGVAPEPTSGLLMLMGVAFLGLKRRKA